MYDKVQIWLEKLDYKDLDQLKLHQNNQILDQSLLIGDLEVGNNINATGVTPKIAPLPPSEGYYTSPDMNEIKKMTKLEIQKVENFKIFNKHGEIRFEGKTDLSGLDLANLVKIEKK